MPGNKKLVVLWINRRHLCIMVKWIAPPKLVAAFTAFTYMVSVYSTAFHKRSKTMGQVPVVRLVHVDGILPIMVPLNK
jgi:hypothetical protein